jgi:hypothetical protein
VPLSPHSFLPWCFALLPDGPLLALVDFGTIFGFECILARALLFFQSLDIVKVFWCETTMPYSDPKFTVVNPAPTVDDCIKSMRFRDYCVLAGVTAASWGYGYVFGKPVRMPTASTAATIGLTFAGLVVLQDTRGRLMGYKENSKEVKLYGAHPNQPELRGVQDPRFPTATGRASVSTKPPLDWKNYD